MLYPHITSPLLHFSRLEFKLEFTKFLNFLCFFSRSTTTSRTTESSPKKTNNIVDNAKKATVEIVVDNNNNFDPCEQDSHIVIANEPHRSANHHLSLGAAGEPPICDRTILPGWYRFDSPAGNLIPTECPGENYCGTRKPVWLNGKFFYHS